MKTLKLISAAVMLITGILTATIGAIETVIKFMETLRPEIKLSPPPPMMEKSMRGIEEIISPSSNFTFPYLGGMELIILGAVLIVLSIWLYNKFND